jgi:hypothetical protein
MGCRYRKAHRGEHAQEKEETHKTGAAASHFLYDPLPPIPSADARRLLPWLSLSVVVCRKLFYLLYAVEIRCVVL